jgi:hypothetical protein
VAPKLAVGLQVRVLPGGTAISVAREVSITTGVLAAVSASRQITACMIMGAATAIPLTMVTAAICRPRTEICQINDEHRRVVGTTSPASSVRGLLPKSVSMMSQQDPGGVNVKGADHPML